MTDMTIGWRELAGVQTVVPGGLAAPPTVQGVIPADNGYVALWFDSATRVAARTNVIAWRVSGPQCWPATLLPTEPTFLQRPDGEIFNIQTGEHWANEGDWMAAQP